MKMLVMDGGCVVSWWTKRNREARRTSTWRGSKGMKEYALWADLEELVEVQEAALVGATARKPEPRRFSPNIRGRISPKFLDKGHSSSRSVLGIRDVTSSRPSSTRLRESLDAEVQIPRAD
ncbi:uncharacterized protein LOC143211079 [Lasioglossum baleicum]|uniref:uncharacterized protein LOC143211079 n=1 Tax=Lasioglossum baleicum TaxID=434251 RepID=UPI003FCD2E4B